MKVFIYLSFILVILAKKKNKPENIEIPIEFQDIQFDTEERVLPPADMEVGQVEIIDVDIFPNLGFGQFFQDFFTEIEQDAQKKNNDDPFSFFPGPSILQSFFDLIPQIDMDDIGQNESGFVEVESFTQNGKTTTKITKNLRKQGQNPEFSTEVIISDSPESFKKGKPALSEDFKIEQKVEEEVQQEKNLDEIYEKMMKDNAKIREVSRFKIDETNEGNLVEKQKIKEEEVEQRIFDIVDDEDDEKNKKQEKKQEEKKKKQNLENLEVLQKLDGNRSKYIKVEYSFVVSQNLKFYGRIGMAVFALGLLSFVGYKLFPSDRSKKSM